MFCFHKTFTWSHGQHYKTKDICKDLASVPSCWPLPHLQGIVCISLAFPPSLLFETQQVSGPFLYNRSGACSPAPALPPQTHSGAHSTIKVETALPFSAGLFSGAGLHRSSFHLPLLRDAGWVPRLKGVWAVLGQDVSPECEFLATCWDLLPMVLSPALHLGH